MINTELNKHIDKIKRLIDNVDSAFEQDDELKSHLAKYLCVLSSGLIENAVFHVYSEFVNDSTNNEKLISFSSSTLNKIQNPNTAKLRNIAKSFNPEWEVELNNFMQEEQRGEAINYILRDRHKIAHGKDSDITIGRLSNYLDKVLEVFEFIEDQCKSPIHNNGL